MWVTLRNTLRRGRWLDPEIRLRCRTWMRRRRSSFVFIFIIVRLWASGFRLPASSAPGPKATGPEVWSPKSEAALLGSGLSGLLLQHFSGIPHALLLVGVRLAQAAQVGGHLAHQLAVHAGHREVRLLVDRDVDPVGD